MLSKINEILKSASYEDLNNLDLSTLSLKDYKKIITSIKDIPKHDYPINQINIFKEFILKVVKQKTSKKDRDNLEWIHHGFLLDWVSIYQSEKIESIVLSNKIIELLIKIVPVQKLNYYNEKTQNSILKQLLLRYENNHLFEIFYKNGLRFKQVEGINCYYYGLLKGTAINIATQSLYGFKVPLPDGYWSYVFTSMAKNKIKKDRNFLLSLKDKEFVVDKETDDTVWSCIIKNKAYDLIKHIPLEFYKSSETMSVLALMKESKDFTLIENLKLDILKLAHSEDELVDLLKYMMENKEHSFLLISSFFSQIVNVNRKNINPNFIKLKKEWEDCKLFTEINPFQIVLKIVLAACKKGEHISLEDEKEMTSRLSDIDEVIKVYKGRIDFSKNTRESILDYLKSFDDFNISTPKQSENFYKSYDTLKNKIANCLYVSSSDGYIENQKKYNLNEKIFGSLLLSLDDTTFNNLCENALIYLKDFKIPQMEVILEKVVKDMPLNDDLLISSRKRGQINVFAVGVDDEKDEDNVFVNEVKLKNSFKEMDIMSGSKEVDAEISAVEAINILKSASNYPKCTPREIKLDKFIEILNNIDQEQNMFLLKDIYQEISKEKEVVDTNGDSVGEVANKDATVEEVTTEVKDDITINLFTEESFKMLENDFAGMNNDTVNDFLKKNGKYKNHQERTLAKASLFLENIDNLYKTFPHFEKVIQHIENFMILQDKGDKSFYIPPLLLGGGPGVGKTFFCSTISKLVSTPFELLNMESMSANFVLTGSISQWKDATPGKIFRNLFSNNQKKMNPIFLLDELEKACGSSQYGVMNSLLPLLERYTAKKFKDECIPLEIDASYIVWFATANDLDKLTAPIKSRFDIFSVPSPNPTQRKSLIKGIYKTVRENNTWGSYFDENLPDDSLDVLANLMAPGAARDLRKSLTMACSKAIKEESSIILPNHIERYENGETMPWDLVE